MRSLPLDVCNTREPRHVPSLQRARSADHTRRHDDGLAVESWLDQSCVPQVDRDALILDMIDATASRGSADVADTRPPYTPAATALPLHALPQVPSSSGGSDADAARDVAWYDYPGVPAGAFPVVAAGSRSHGYYPGLRGVGSGCPPPPPPHTSQLLQGHPLHVGEGDSDVAMSSVEAGYDDDAHGVSGTGGADVPASHPPREVEAVEAAPAAATTKRRGASRRKQQQPRAAEAAEPVPPPRTAEPQKSRQPWQVARDDKVQPARAAGRVAAAPSLQPQGGALTDAPWRAEAGPLAAGNRGALSSGSRGASTGVASTVGASTGVLQLSALSIGPAATAARSSGGASRVADAARPPLAAAVAVAAVTSLHALQPRAPTAYVPRAAPTARGGLGLGSPVAPRFVGGGSAGAACADASLSSQPPRRSGSSSAHGAPVEAHDKRDAAASAALGVWVDDGDGGTRRQTLLHWLGPQSQSHQQPLASAQPRSQPALATAGPGLGYATKAKVLTATAAAGLVSAGLTTRHGGAMSPPRRPATSVVTVNLTSPASAAAAAAATATVASPPRSAARGSAAGSAAARSVSPQPPSASRRGREPHQQAPQHRPAPASSLFNLVPADSTAAVGAADGPVVVDRGGGDLRLVGPPAIKRRRSGSSAAGFFHDVGAPGVSPHAEPTFVASESSFDESLEGIAMHSPRQPQRLIQQVQLQRGAAAAATSPARERSHGDTTSAPQLMLLAQPPLQPPLQKPAATGAAAPPSLEAAAAKPAPKPGVGLAHLPAQHGPFSSPLVASLAPTPAPLGSASTLATSGSPLSGGLRIVRRAPAVAAAVFTPSPPRRALGLGLGPGASPARQGGGALPNTEAAGVGATASAATSPHRLPLGQTLTVRRGAAAMAAARAQTGREASAESALVLADAVYAGSGRPAQHDDAGLHPSSAALLRLRRAKAGSDAAAAMASAGLLASGQGTPGAAGALPDVAVAPAVAGTSARPSKRARRGGA